MKTYKITVPEFTQIINADSKKEALEIFLFNYDNAQQDMEFNQPIVKEIKDAKKDLQDTGTKNIEIEVEGGVVMDVRGLPAGWTYTIVDRDE